MENYIDELIKDIPEALRPLTLMEDTNEPIIIYQGNFELSAKGSIYVCFGKIEFLWLPSKHIRFSAILNSNIQLVHEQSANTIFEVIIQGRHLFKAFLTGNTIANNSTKMSIGGQLCPGVIVGDKEILADSVRFEVANLKSLFGNTIKTGHKVCKSRLVFESDRYLIVIDKLPDFDVRYNELKQKGGFILTHTGSLIKKGGRISYAETEAIIHNLKYFLSFINGRRTSPIFINGIHTDYVAWTSYDLREIDQYKSVWSWAINLHTEGLAGLWDGFLKHLEIAPYTWLKTSLHWYFEANRQIGYAEGSIVIIQCALELLYNRLVENGEIPSPKKKDHRSAEINIRNLLSFYSLSNKIPPHHINSKNYSNGEHDGPGMLVLLRNALVHSKEAKREKLKDIPPLVFAEVLQLGIFYVEISLLKSLGYRGAVFNRSEEVLFSDLCADQSKNS